MFRSKLITFQLDKLNKIKKKIKIDINSDNDENLNDFFIASATTLIDKIDNNDKNNSNYIKNFFIVVNDKTSAINVKKIFFKNKISMIVLVFTIKVKRNKNTNINETIEIFDINDIDNFFITTFI